MIENQFVFLGLTGIEKAVLQDDCIAKIFRSGGGLRVMRIEKKDEKNTLVGYGEHVTFIPMLNEASRSYNNGNIQDETTYLTGDPTPDCMLDTWTLSGNKIFIEKDQDNLKISLKNSDDRVNYEIKGKSLASTLFLTEKWLEFLDGRRLVENKSCEAPRKTR
ncbi:MAG: hypothetical protein ACOXZS_01415 [Bacilli bacterium]|jgi:hypothetical protein